MVELRSVRSLPVSWDGEPVDWGRWEGVLPVFICDRSRRKVAVAVCAGCGIPDGARRAQCWGMRRGRRDLFAIRCLDCGHDVVLDKRTGDAWDLGPEDYGLSGSNPPG